MKIFYKDFCINICNHAFPMLVLRNEANIFVLVSCMVKSNFHGLNFCLTGVSNVSLFTSEVNLLLFNTVRTLSIFSSVISIFPLLCKIIHYHFGNHIFLWKYLLKLKKLRHFVINTIKL
jgi:hypothetical protein